MDLIIWAETETVLQPNDMNREDGLILSKSWKPLIHSLKNGENLTSSPPPLTHNSNIRAQAPLPPASSYSFSLPLVLPKDPPTL